MNKVKFFVSLIIMLFVTWFLAEGLSWLSLQLKPMTDLGFILERSVMHIVMVFLSIYFAISFSEE